MCIQAYYTTPKTGVLRPIKKPLISQELNIITLLKGCFPQMTHRPYENPLAIVSREAPCERRQLLC